MIYNIVMDISSKIEALLFYKAEPVTTKKLSEILKTDSQSIEQGLIELQKKLEHRGLSLVRTKDEVLLGTNKELSSLIEEVTKEEISRDIGKAGLETLSIILYQGPISRADIDYIRGVNSQFILRNLLIRGLIERTDNKVDARIFLYKPSLTLLTYLGISKIEDLPEYDAIRKDIKSYKNDAIKDQQEK